ncbi:hypothetical protein D3C86_394900 [compost metagenome]
MSSDNHKTKILGDFLKSRRERIKPDHIEMIGRFGRRRTPGLRREEVAHLGGFASMANVRPDLTVPLDQLGADLDLATAAASIVNLTTAYLAIKEL